MVSYRKERHYATDVHVVEYNQKTNPSQISFGVVGKKEKLSAINHQWYEDNGYQEAAKINLGFFDYSAPIEHYGLVMHDSGFAKGHPNSVHGIEVYLTHENELVVRDVAMSEVEALKSKVYWGATASYALVINGKKDLRKSEHYRALAQAKHPRTMLGQKADGTMVLAVADGRSSWDAGLTGDESAEVMLKLGCVNAVNFDGGGSSEIIFKGRIQNSPSDGFERSIGTALLVFEKTTDTPVPDLTLPNTDLPTPAVGLSPNKYSNRKLGGQQGKPEIIVLHLTEGYFDGAVSWLSNPVSQASANIVARKSDGYLVRLVDDKDGPWTNGKIQKPTAKKVVDYQKRKLNPNLFSLTIEMEWFQSWGIVPVGSPMYNSVVQQVALWCVMYDIPADRDHILGHYEIDSIDKPFCGRHIPWEAFVKDVKQLVEKHNGQTDDATNDKPNIAHPYHRVFYDDKQQGAFSVEGNAYNFGWEAFNRGHDDAYLIYKTGERYTFAEHPEDNPRVQETVRYQVQTDTFTDKDTALKIIAELKEKYGIAGTIISVTSDRS